MKTLVIDARMILHSGIGTYLQNLIPLLAEASCRIVLMGDPLKLSCYTFADILPCSAPIYSFQEQTSLPRKIPCCDLFWSPHFNAPVFPVRAQRRIVTIHDVFHLVFRKNFGVLQRKWAKILIKKAIHTSDRVITVSQFSKSEIMKFIDVGEEKIEVIYPGVDRELFASQDSGLDEVVKMKYQLPSKFILFVGSAKPHKNLKGVLEAFQSLEKEIHLVVTGMKGFCEENERVHFLDFVPKNELPSLYRLASIFVFPSLYEGFGLPPLEAMSANCVVLASSRASIPEVCQDAVLYADPENVDEIILGLNRLLSDGQLCNRLRTRGQERAHLFDWEETALKHLEVFEIG